MEHMTSEKMLMQKDSRPLPAPEGQQCRFRSRKANGVLSTDAQQLLQAADADPAASDTQPHNTTANAFCEHEAVPK
jgi:hypothetical protein